MSSFLTSESQAFFPFGGGVSNTDAIIQKSFPGLEFNPSETGGEYQEVREIDGALYFAQNAQYNTAAGLAPTATNAWYQVNPLLASYVWVQNAGVWTIYKAAATLGSGLTPITLSTISFQAAGAVVAGAATAYTGYTAGDLVASRNVNTGALWLGGSTSTVLLDYNASAAGAVSLTGVGVSPSLRVAGAIARNITYNTAFQNFEWNSSGGTSVTGISAYSNTINGVQGNAMGVNQGASYLLMNLDASGNLATSGALYPSSGLVITGATSLTAGSNQTVIINDGTGANSNGYIRTSGTGSVFFQNSAGTANYADIGPAGGLALFATASAKFQIAGPVIPGTAGVAGTAGIYSGTGVPTFSAPNGSLFMRYDGATSSTCLYVNTSGASTSGTTWTAVTVP